MKRLFLFSDNAALSSGKAAIAVLKPLEYFKLKANLTISLVKNISLAAGLAGGSANGQLFRGLANSYNNPQSRIFFNVHLP